MRADRPRYPEVIHNPSPVDGFFNARFGSHRLPICTIVGTSPADVDHSRVPDEEGRIERRRRGRCGTDEFAHIAAGPISSSPAPQETLPNAPRDVHIDRVAPHSSDSIITPAEQVDPDPGD